VAGSFASGRVHCILDVVEPIVLNVHHYTIGFDYDQKSECAERKSGRHLDVIGQLTRCGHNDILHTVHQHDPGPNEPGKRVGEQFLTGNKSKDQHHFSVVL